MRLSDIMGNMQLETYAEVGLLIFMLVFAAVVVRVFSKKYALAYEAARQLPLDDEPASVAPAEAEQSVGVK